MIKNTLLAVAGILALSAPLAAEEIGQIKKASGTVSIDRGGKSTPAVVGIRLHAADTIVTGGDGAIGIALTDNSLLSAGPNSRLDLSHYRFDTTTHEGRFDATLHKGTLSMISGKLTKQSPDAVKVITPTSVLAVRGTEFFVEVDGSAK